MDSNQKHFGMTNSQLGIVGGLAVLVCCLFALAGWLIFGTGIDFSRPPAIPPTPASTPTLVVIPTLTPTTAPTAIPYEQLIPQGWVQHRTSLIEIWLPREFSKSDTGLFLVDPSNPAVPEIQFATNTAELYRRGVGIFFEPLTSESLDEFLDKELPKLPPEVRVTERKNELINSTPVVRLLLEQKIENIDVNILVFVFLDGGTVWYVEYAAQINEFYNHLETFEKSVLTFRLVK